MQKPSKLDDRKIVLGYGKSLGPVDCILAVYIIISSQPGKWSGNPDAGFAGIISILIRPKKVLSGRKVFDGFS